MMSTESGFVYGDVLDEIKVLSMHSPTTYYVIRCGYVSWGKNDDFKPVIYVLMEYKGYLEKHTNPPHYMIEPDKDGVSDVTKVINAIEELKKRFRIK